MQLTPDEKTALTALGAGDSPLLAVSQLAETMSEASEGLSLVLLFLREEVSEPASIYWLSKTSGLSVSAIKNRLAKPDVRTQLDRLLNRRAESEHVLVDLSRLPKDVRAAVETALD